MADGAVGHEIRLSGADAVKMCQVLDKRMKSEKGLDGVGELKLLLVRLGAVRP